MRADAESILAMPLEDLWGLIADVFEKGGKFRLFPRGVSMLPLIREGKDEILLEAPKTIKKWDILLYRREDGTFVLHRLISVAKDGLVLCGDNQAVLERGVPRVAILARVCGIFRDGEYLSVDSPQLRRYARRRVASRPIRHMASSVRSLLKKKK